MHNDQQCCDQSKTSCPLGILSVYALFIMTFGLAALSKMTPTVPEWFLTKFGATILNLFPGQLSMSFYFLAIGELLTTLLFIFSLLKGEFRAGVDKKWLTVALHCSMAMFVVLGFGLRLVHDYDGAGELFSYFAGTVVCLLFVKKC